MTGVRLRLVGVGAMNSPRYRPAGLLAGWRGHRVLLDGGGDATGGARSGDGGAAGEGAAGGWAVRGGARLDGWLVSDERAELMPRIRRAARALGMTAGVAAYEAEGVEIVPLPVTHTSHPTYGYLIRTERAQAAWAPEFWAFPVWAAGVDLMFADAAGWDRPIRFAGGVGGHASVLQVARRARDLQVARLVFAHIGRPSIRAIDRGERPLFGEWGVEGRTYDL
ncbi:MBL fold metallo-hydrolase [Nonomuraea phyllanthi]|uniref:MBL fold metallo-hydrolase n=1 Tax=Nonomuraea phyllanthi TaxID=2219224 RepID=UPI001D15D860|nr:MBL fold metallo-hydrolase [Nonomuraea phyllanthi]